MIFRIYDLLKFRAILKKNDYKILSETNLAVNRTYWPEYVFLGAFIENGTVAWPGNIDIDPETLYERSVLIGATRNL